MSKLKKLGIGIGIIILIFFALVIVAVVTNDDSTDRKIIESVPLSTTEEITTKLIINDLLPKRDDIGTEWRIKEIYEKSKNTTGFVTGIEQTFTKGASYSSSTVVVNILEFDNKNNVKNYYDSRVESKKDKGGYKELEIKYPESECYGTYEDYDLQEIFRIRCITENYQVYSFIRSSDFDGEENARMFTEVMLNKINVKN